MNCRGCRNCRNFLRISSITLTPIGGADAVAINIAPQTLSDGQRYCVKLDVTFPAGVTGTEMVYIVNGTQQIQLTDYRAQELISAQLRQNDRQRLFMQFTLNSVADAPIFRVLEGVKPLA